MASIGSLEVSLSLNASNFNGTVAQVNRNMRAMGSELQAIRARGSEYENSLTGLSQKQNVLSRSFDAASIKLQEQRRRYDELVASGTASSAQIERQANAVNQAQTQYNRLERELAEVTEQLRIQSSQWTQVGQRMQEVGGKLSSIGDGLMNVGKKLSMYVTAPIAAMGVGAFKAASDFESAFAGVRKTVDATESEFQFFSDEIRNMSKEIPTAATEIAKVAEAAGQLGIKNDAIIGFTRTMTDMGVATNMSADEAATALARFANITKMSQQDFDKLGSTVVDLGNNFATTESEIIDMALRLAGAGAQIGMSEADILGLATALSSVGIQAEMGGSALSRVMVRMQVAASTGLGKTEELSRKTGMSLRELQMLAANNSMDFTSLADSLGMTNKEMKNIVNAGVDLENFAKVAGMTSKDFKEAFEKDAVGAIGAFVNGLGTAEQAGDSAINMLQEMGITEILLRDSLLRAGNANELFASSIDIANKAWEENAALTNEAEQRYKTTESQLIILKNKVIDLGITLGNILIPVVLSIVEVVGPWIEKFASLSEGTQKLILVLGGIAAAIGPVILVAGALVSSVGAIVSAFGTVALAVGEAGGVVAMLTAKLGFLGPAFSVLTGPIGITVAALSGLAIGAVAFAKHMSNDALPSAERFGKGVSESTKNALNGFFDLSEGASQSVTRMYVSSTEVTSEMAKELTSKFDQMNKQIVEGMKKRNADQLSDLQDFFMFSSALTSEEEQKIMADTERRNEWQLKEQNAMNENVKAIIQKATDEKRELTEREHEIINNYNRMMKENAVRTFSESELEQKVILERMKENASIISAEQAAEVVKNAVKQKEEVIKEANESYEKRIAQIIQMRDETGQINAEQADRMIAEATRAKDQTILLAEEQHQKIVETAQKQADEHVEKVNWETGEMLSKWEVFKNKHSEIFSAVEETYKKITDSLKEVTATAYDYIKTTVNEKLGFVVDFVKEQLDKLKEFWDENGQQILEITKFYYKNLQSNIELALGIIKGIFEIFWPIISALVKFVWETIKLTIGNALDLILGIIQTILKLIQGDWEGAWKSIKVTAENIMNNIVKYFKNIDLFQVAVDIFQGLINGFGSMAEAVWKKAESVAGSIETAIRKKLNTHSPSRVMIAVGQDIGEGLAIGIDSTQERNENAMKELGQLIINATKANQAEVTKIADEAEKKRSKIQADAAKKKLDIEKKLGVDLQKANNTSSSRKKGPTANDTLRVQQLKETANAKLVKLEQDTQEKLKKINDKATADMVKKEEKAASERLTVIKRFIDDKKSTDELSLVTEAHILEESLKLFKDGTKEKIDIQKMYKKVTESIQKEEESINKTYLDNVKKLNDDYIKEEERLTKVYEDEFKKRRDSYYSFAGLFDEVAQRDVSGSALISALQSQVTAFEDWQKNIANLASKGINEGLLAELQEMGPKAGAEIAALNTLTEEQLAEYTELWKTKNEQARTQAETELTGLKQNTEKQINDLRLKTADQLRVYQTEWRNSMIALKGSVKTEMEEMPNIGVFAVSGLIDGMMSKKVELMNAAQTLAAIVTSAFTGALDIHSPSRVMKGYGINIGEGLILGINEMVGKVAGATKRLAKTVTDGTVNSMPSTTTSSTTNNTENNFNLNVTSPKPLDPYETARLSKNSWKEMALQIG
ncbi:phage tail tape measure protein, TP901 family [Lysinibacillus capsici]|uniref:Phage tail tape measure protein, TP901 family n=1 Tax=Lysinibacillus capsici TaxID=2115968 RepID=A0A2X1A3A2_9BACI|nr:phage tail tape measure protein [Lysinibacillus capsici]SPU37920.1 phage tail tape measure protein, TP901 family [Lysinibacillus capsici]